jgi:hypothetical protein
VVPLRRNTSFWISSVLAVSYLAFSIPAVVAGAAVTDLGLRETAEIYGLVLIAVAAIALALSGRLGDAAEVESSAGEPIVLAARADSADASCS